MSRSYHDALRECDRRTLLPSTVIGTANPLVGITTLVNETCSAYFGSSEKIWMGLRDRSSGVSRYVADEQEKFIYRAQ